MFAKVVSLSLATALTMACAMTGASAQSDTGEMLNGKRKRCSSNGEPGLWPDQLERECLARLDGIVAREGDVLRITLRDGATKAFKDAPPSCMQSKAGTPCVYYVLIGHHHENDAVVIERRLSGPTHSRLGAYMMELEAGRVIDLPGLPSYAPDGSRFISLAVCADHCANRIDIWEIRDGRAKLEWRHRVGQGTTNTFHYRLLNWQANEQVNLRIFREFEAEGDAGKGIDEAEGKHVRLTHTTQGWTFDPPLPR
jgi:hypothetical protein